MSTTVSSVIKFFPSAQNGFQTTLASTIASGATTVPLNSVAGYNNGEIAVMVVDPTSPTLKQTFTGVVDTAGVQLTSVVWTAGTNQIHAGGATVVDYATATHISMITKGIKVNHTDKGNHKTLTDDNGNEWLLQSSVASAVNEVTLANAATGTFPSLRASGGDSNVDLLLGGKGTGSVRFSGIHDGWTDCFETLTYASATTFTCSAALAATLAVGDRLKLTQTTVKYFYVVGISGTTVTVTGGSDYTLANAAITLPYYSKTTTPTGFPQWFNYSPTYTGFSSAPTLGTGSIRFTINGRTCVFDHSTTTNGTSNATTMTVSAPVTCSTSAPAGALYYALCQIRDNGATAGTSGVCQIGGSGTSVSVFRDNGGTAFTTSGGKNGFFTIAYEI